MQLDHQIEFDLRCAPPNRVTLLKDPQAVGVLTAIVAFSHIAILPAEDSEKICSNDEGRPPPPWLQRYAGNFTIGSCYTATLKYNYDFPKLRGGFIEPKFAACYPWSKYQLAFESVRSDQLRPAVQPNRFAWNNFHTGTEIVRKLNDKLKLTVTAEISVPLAAIDQFAEKEAWIGLRFTADF